MKQSFEIRRATIADLPSIFKLQTALNRYIIQAYDRTWNNSRIANRRQETLLRRAVRSKKSLLLVARHQSKVVGFSWSEIYKSSWHRRPMLIAEGYAIYVLPAFRSSGAGRALLKGFFRWAKKNKADRIRGATDVANTRALKLYRRLSWKPYMVILESDATAVRV